MSDTPWSEFHRRWPRLTPPLRPNADICAALKRLIAGRDERALMLGVTPELTVLAKDTVAVDWSDKMLALVWPGNTVARRAVKGNWLEMPCADRSFDSAIGDGSLNCLAYEEGYRLVFAQLARVLKPGGRVAIRMYLTPENCEPLDGVRDKAMSGRVKGIHGLKWLIANAICAERQQPNIAVQTILEVFNRLFPDREALRRAAGWDADEIEQIDAYKGLPDVFSFPTPRQVLEIVPNRFASAFFEPAGTYELAERCPFLVLDVKP